MQLTPEQIEKDRELDAEVLRHIETDCDDDDCKLCATYAERVRDEK